MDKYKIYASPSVQQNNVGVGDYGTEEERMNQVIDWFVYYMKYQPKFLVERNNPAWGLAEIKKASDAFGACRHLAVHSDAASNPEAQGTTAFYAAGYEDSKNFATSIYNAIAPLSPGKDRGIHPDTDLYPTGLGELRAVKATACLVELGFHTNPQDAQDIVNRTRIYGKELARATVQDCGEMFIDPDQVPKPVIDVLEPVNPEDLPDVLMTPIVPEGTRFIKLPVGYIEFIPEAGRVIWHRDKNIYIGMDQNGVTACNHGTYAKIV